MPDGIKVLLIEDDTAVRIGSEQALQLAGFSVESFESAERAVGHIKPGMVAGPTNAVAILLFASLGHLASPGSADYIHLVLTVAFLTGLIELVMGVSRLGGLVNFISHTVIVGFSAGAAILIGAQQLKSFLGIPIPPDASFVQTLRQTIFQLGHINPWVTSVGLFTIVSGLVAKRYLKKIPFMSVILKWVGAWNGS